MGDHPQLGKQPRDWDARAAVLADTGAGIPWRCIGPHRGGRVVAVAGDPNNPAVFYFGACAGGVWKSADAGTYWENVSDGAFSTAAVGALAIAPSDSNVIYAGTGETTIRGNVSHGDGVYRSRDGGRTWQNIGLGGTRHIAKIRIHPADPDLLYVAAFGHAWGPNPERGVYRSRDAGASWESILFVSDRAGAIDLTMDPHNPRILYAAMWEAQRSPYSLSSGGPGSGLYKSADGGESWVEVSANPGFPTGVKGKIGIAASPTQADRVWALVEAHDGALLRSDDGGRTWKRVSEEGDLRKRAWYYMHVVADPGDADTVWVLNLQCWKSIDAGRTFAPVATPHGDNHDLWIDPSDSRRMIEGNDGGACVSLNGGISWSTLYNQPTAQLYHVTTDSSFPYRVYGSQQDNTAISLPTMSRRGAITQQDWYEPGGGESGYIAVHPDTPSIVYGGAIGSGDFNGRLLRYDHSTGGERDVTVWPDTQGMGDGADTLRYRFQWTFPLCISRYDHRVLYSAANKVLRSCDEGASWEEISPDLTRNDPATLGVSGGPITKDNTGAEVYGTVFALAESFHEAGVMWAGSDDGLVWLTRDGGQSWTDVTPADLPEWSLISVIEPSPADPSGAYLCATRYKLDDTRPYLYRTNDFGRTWTSITEGIPNDEFARVVRADPVAPGLLFAGTETGLYVSFTDGQSWDRFMSNLPVVPLYDLAVKDDELIAATHGRSFWILDDITPLRRLASADVSGGVHLFPPPAATRVGIQDGWGYKPTAAVNYRNVGTLVAAFRGVRRADGTIGEQWLDAGKNPPLGVSITYFLPSPPEGEVRLVVRDAGGEEIDRFSSVGPESGRTEMPDEASETDVSGAGEGREAGGAPPTDDEPQRPLVPANRGINRFVWNMRYPDAERLPGEKALESLAGPFVLPGRYEIELEVGGESFTESFEIVGDPAAGVTSEDLRAQLELALRVRDTLSSVHSAVIKIRGVVGQIETWSALVRPHLETEDLLDALGRVKRALRLIEDSLVQRESSSPLNPPSRLNYKLAALLQSVQHGDFAPTRGQAEVYAALSQQVTSQLEAFHRVMAADVADLNGRMRDLKIPHLSLPM